MLTHAEDYRIMQDEDMETAKRLSTEDGGLGHSQREARLLACIRLLLAHIEGIKNGAVKVVEELDEKRDPPCNDMTDMYDEGYAQCKADAADAIRGALNREDEQ